MTPTPTLWSATARPRATEAMRFMEFDRDNPEVWRLFQWCAVCMRDRGHKRYSARAIVHQIRWQCDLLTKTHEPFKIDDHYARFYGQKLMDVDIRFKGFFEVRKAR